jgi:hypothetical protein
MKTLRGSGPASAAHEGVSLNAFATSVFGETFAGQFGVTLYGLPFSRVAPLLHDASEKVHA